MSEDKRAKLRHNLWFGFVVFLILWTGCVYIELFRMQGVHKLFAFNLNDDPKQPVISDFVNVYNSACLAAAAQKEKIDIYSPALQAEYSLKLTAPIKPEQPFYLQYPPMLFALVRPLALFDMFGAWVVWCSLGVLGIVVSTVALVRATSARVTTAGPGKTLFGVGAFTMVFAIAATLASFPSWYSVRLGQTSLLLVPGLAAFWVCCLKRRYFLAGLASGVVLVKLQYLPPVFIVGALVGAWKFLGGFSVIGVLLLVLSIAIVGMDNVMRFPQALLKGESSQGVSGVAAEQMQNVRGNLTLLVGGDNTLVHLLSIGAFALGMAALIFLWWRARRKGLDTTTTEGASKFRVLASISTIIMLVLSPHCHMQDYLALVIPCIWLWFECVDKAQDLPVMKMLRRLVLSFPILGWPFYVFLFLFQLIKIEPFFLWAVVVMGLALNLYRDLKTEAKNTNEGG
ncbi:MAG: DUF2029 domain-containing protein [Cyanobacteria bacterium SZAS TMP-1]|nr:DUF2029 domain-containing protein [Cyanobacteria bacterium SZAS TMP-1]